MATWVGKNERGSVELILVAVIVVAIIGALGYVTYSNMQKNTAGKPAADTSQKKTLTHPDIITSAVFTTSVDSTGAPVGSTTEFTPSTPKVYVVLGLKNAKASQRVEYTRYLNGKFVDNGSIPLKDNAKYASFAFTLQPGKTRPTGTYIVKVYTNGVYERSATYTVK